MSQFKSNYSREEQEQCVQQYLSGISKEDLSEKWNISVRTINRWIKKICSYEQKEALKRKDVIPQEKEDKIIDILNQNAILHGFNISAWDSGTVKKLLENKFNIEISRYKAKQLLDHSKKFYNEIEDRELKEIEKLEDLNYNIVLLDFIKIGEIKRIKVEDTYYERFNGDILNVNLGIARAPNRAYIVLIYSDTDIITYGFSGVFYKPNKAEKEKIKFIEDDKIAFINKVIENEGDINKVVFVSRKDIFMKRFKKSNKKPLFYILNKNFEEDLIQDIYELGEENSLLKNIKDNDDNYIEFSTNKEIFQLISDKIQKYNKKGEIVSILKYI
ncbi:hypothetical protein AB2T85_17800 [Clostridium butyricum]|uniref:hypothetical protein n=1 Tax=Clostridium butyricum TaxID=1492 RepID=UPI00346658E8